MVYTISCAWADLCFELRGQKAYHDGYTDIMVDIYCCTLYKINILYFAIFSAQSSVSELEASMLCDYLRAYLSTDTVVVSNSCRV